MELAEIRLEHDDLGVLGLDRAVGFQPLSFDLGTAEPRISERLRPGSHGIDDYTQFFGARAVMLRLGLLGSDEVDGAADTTDALLRQLGAYMRPDRRPVLAYRWGGDDTLWRVQCSPRTWPRTFNGEDFTFQQVILGFKVPSGLIEGYDLQSATILAAGVDAGGRPYDLAFPRNYPTAGARGRTSVVNEGTVPADFVARLYGPAGDPTFGNETTGELLEFTANGGLTLLAGEYVEIDTKAGTVRLNGDAGLSRYGRIDLTNFTGFPRLQPGTNEIRYTSATATSPAQAVIEYRHAYI